MSISRRRLAVLFLSPLVLLLASAAFYTWAMGALEGEPRTFLESLQFAAETLTTTGYGADARWHHPALVVFVVLLQFLGVGLVFLVVPIVLIPYLESRFETRLPRAVGRIRDHVLIYRWGAGVSSLVEELVEHGVPVVIAEEDEATARRLLEDGLRVVHGRGPGELLAGGGLATARALVANDGDSENAAIALTARQAGFSGTLVALAEEPHHRRPIQLAGADRVFTPAHMLAAALAARASHRISPRVSGIQRIGPTLQLSEIRVAASSPLAGQTLGEAAVGRRTGTTIIGQWVAGRLEAQPTATTRLRPHGVLVAVGSPANLERLAELAGGSHRVDHPGPFLVLGHGAVGSKVVELLREVDELVRVVDRLELPGVDLVGDVLDPRVLEEAGLGESRCVVIALDDDASTLFATVIAQDLSRETPVIARVNDAENVERIHRAGADFALALSQVSGQILAGQLLGERSLSVDVRLKVLEVPGRGFAGRSLGELELRRRTGCSVVAVDRDGEVHVELGDGFVFRDDDAVYVCGSQRAVRRLAKTYR